MSLFRLRFDRQPAANRFRYGGRGILANWLLPLLAVAFVANLQADCGEEVSLEIVKDGSSQFGNCCYKFIFKNNTSGTIKAGAIIIEAPQSRNLLDQVYESPIEVAEDHIVENDGGYLVIYQASAEFVDVMAASPDATGEFVIATICFDSAAAWADYNGNLKVYFEYEVDGHYSSCTKEILAKSCLGENWDQACCDGLDFWWDVQTDPCPPHGVTKCVLRYRAHFFQNNSHQPLREIPKDPYWTRCTITTIAINGQTLPVKLFANSEGEIDGESIKGQGPVLIELYDKEGKLKCSKSLPKPFNCP